MEISQANVIKRKIVLIANTIDFLKLPKPHKFEEL